MSYEHAVIGCGLVLGLGYLMVLPLVLLGMSWGMLLSTLHWAVLLLAPLVGALVLCCQTLADVFIVSVIGASCAIAVSVMTYTVWCLVVEVCRRIIDSEQIVYNTNHTTPTLHGIVVEHPGGEASIIIIPPNPSTHHRVLA